MKIGNKIRFHRKKAGLSRIELARLSGIGKTVIYDVEHGRLTVRFSSLLKLFKILNIKLIFSSPYMEEFESRDDCL